MHDTKVLPDRLMLSSSLFYSSSLPPYPIPYCLCLLLYAPCAPSRSLTEFPASFKSFCLLLIVAVLFYFIIIVISHFSRGLSLSVSCIKWSLYSCSNAYICLLPHNTGRGTAAISHSIQSISMILIFGFIKVQKRFTL